LIVVAALEAPAVVAGLAVVNQAIEQHSGHWDGDDRPQGDGAKEIWRLRQASLGG